MAGEARKSCCWWLDARYCRISGEDYYSIVQAGMCEPLLDTIKHLHVSALSKSSTKHVMVVMLLVDDQSQFPMRDSRNHLRRGET